MRLKLITALFLCASASACGSNEPPGLIVSDISVLTPLPGQDVSVAYLKLQNNSEQAMTLHDVESPQFASVVMHETKIVNNIARMQTMESLTIDANSQEVFTAGGKHLMLHGPITAPRQGMAITLQFTYGADSMTVAKTVMLAR